MTGHISKTLFKNGDIRYFINMKCVQFLFGFLVGPTGLMILDIIFGDD